MLPRTFSALVLLFATLSTVACSKNQPPRGFLVDLAIVPESCGDGRNVVAMATGGHRARINGGPDIPIAEIAPRLREMLRYRAEHIVYVEAEPDVSWGEFMELIDRLWPDVKIVSLITPQTDVLARQRMCLAPKRQ